MDISEVRKGSKIMIDGVPYNVEEAEFMKPGKGSAIYRYKLRNLIDGSSTNKTYHSGEKFTGANVSTREGQFLYRDGNQFYFYVHRKLMNSTLSKNHYWAIKAIS